MRDQKNNTGTRNCPVETDLCQQAPITSSRPKLRKLGQRYILVSPFVCAWNHSPAETCRHDNKDHEHVEQNDLERGGNQKQQLRHQKRGSNEPRDTISQVTVIDRFEINTTSRSESRRLGEWDGRSGLPMIRAQILPQPPPSPGQRPLQNSPWSRYCKPKQTGKRVLTAHFGEHGKTRQ